MMMCAHFYFPAESVHFLKIMVKYPILYLKHESLPPQNTTLMLFLPSIEGANYYTQRKRL